MSERLTATQVAGWADEVVVADDRIGRHFSRSEPRPRAAGYIRGLLSQAARKNGWHLAEALGDPTPDVVQHLTSQYQESITYICLSVSIAFHPPIVTAAKTYARTLPDPNRMPASAAMSFKIFVSNPPGLCTRDDLRVS